MSQDRKIEASDLNVLVIDDHPQMRKAISRVLVDFDFQEMFEVGTGGDAIKVLREEPIDFVVCDLYLLDVSGFDVLEFIRNRAVDADIPIIVVTGEASKEDIVKAADIGANDYLLKPFKAEDLAAKVTKILTIYQDPKEDVKLQRKADRLFLEKKFAEALDVTHDCLKLDSQSLKARHLMALILDKLGKTDQALEILQENIKINDNFYRTYAALAEIYHRKGLKVEAIDFILKELTLNPKQPRRQTQVGNMLLASGRVEEAINHYREALKENVRYKNALFGMGQAYAELDNIDKSIYYFRRLRRYYPTNTRALEALVKVCLDANEVRKAEYTLRDEKGANKNRLDTYLVLGKLYLAVDEKDKAMAVLEELLVLKPDSVQGLKLKAATHMRMNAYQPAITIYEELLKREDDPETRIQLADIFFKCKNVLQAIQTLHGTVGKDFDRKGVDARLATAYADSNQSLKSHLLFKKLSQKLPLSKNLLETAKRAHKGFKIRRIRRNNPVAS